MSDASTVGEVHVKVRPRANAAEFERELETQAGPAARKAGEGISRQLTEALTAGAFVAFSATVVRSAAEAEQAVGGTQAVFKETSGVIDDFAAGSAEAIGLTEQATRQFTSQIGSALKGYGFSIEEAAQKSTELVTLGSDLAATFGGTVPDAVTALSASLRGEFDPLERYGVSLTAAAVGAKAVALGLADSTSNVDGHAKALATLAIIQEQTADAQGQFNRELGTAGGQMAVATAKLGDARDELGSRFLPLVTKGAGLVSSLADAFGAMPGPIQAAIAGMVGLVALSGPLGRVKGSVDGVREAFAEGGAEAEAFRGKLSAIAKTGVVVAGLAAITGGIEAFNQATTDAQGDFAKSLPDVSDIAGFRDAVNEAVARQNELSDTLNEFTDGDGDAQELIDGLAKSWNFFTSSITGNVSEVGAAKAEYDALTASLPAAKAKAEDLVNAVNTLGERMGVTGAEAADLVDNFKGLDITHVPMDRLVDVLGRLQRGEIDTATAAEQLGVSVKTAGDEAQEAADRYDKLKAGLFDLVDAAHSYEDSVQGVADAERAAERSARQVEDARRAQADAFQGIADAADAYEDSQRAVADAEQRRIDSLRSVADAVRAVEDAERALREAQQGPTESDDLDLEAAQLRIDQMRKRLADIEDPTDRRLAEIDLRRAEIDLAERRAEIDGRAAIAQQDLQTAQERLAEAERGASDAAVAVTEAREAQAAAARGLEDANYNAQRATQAVTDAERAAEQASRDVEDARYDQLKASEELATKIGEEQLAFAGANTEVSKLVDYYRNLIALRPELASAIQPLLALLESARAPKVDTGAAQPGGIGAPFQTPGSGGSGTPPPTSGGGGGGAFYRPPGIYDGVWWPGGIVYPGQNSGAPAANSGPSNVIEINAYGLGADEAAREIARRTGNELAQAAGW